MPVCVRKPCYLRPLLLHDAGCACACRYDWVIQKKIPFKIVSPRCEWDPVNDQYFECVCWRYRSTPRPLVHRTLFVCFCAGRLSCRYAMSDRAEVIFGLDPYAEVNPCAVCCLLCLPRFAPPSTATARPRTPPRRGVFDVRPCVSPMRRSGFCRTSPASRSRGRLGTQVRLLRGVQPS